MGLIKGGEILRLVKAKCEPLRNNFAEKNVTIVRFLPPIIIDDSLLAKYRAAEISAVEKVKTFTYLNCEVNYLLLSSLATPLEFREILENANSDEDTIGIIVQNPVPRLLVPELRFLSPNKDLDGMQPLHPLSLFRASATSEAIVRLIRAFATENSKVAVVGGRGFVGGGVAYLLELSGIKSLVLELGDELTKTNEADIVVSATGVPEILNETHLNSSHKLVVDAGFIPIANKVVFGDVKASAYSIPQNITPVPGGVGPLQMATLLERTLTILGENIEGWRYEKL